MSSTSPVARGRPTALDVAQRAGVSRTTVSFVLNGRAAERGITAATAERVTAAAADLGYVPDRAARSLRSGLSDLVVFAAPGPQPLSTLALHVITELTDLLVREGLHLVIRRVAAGRPLHEVWRQLSPAAVVGFELGAPDLEDLRSAGVPAVSFAMAAFDAALGTAQARHLLSAGHTVLGYVAPQEHQFRVYGDRRLGAVRRTCAEAGVAEPVVVSCALDVASATGVVRALVEHGGVTAVCAYNDEHAFAVLAAMAELGLRAPADLAVIGADNDPLSALAVPALTTVDPGTVATAEHLLQQVLAALGTPTAHPLAVRAPQVRVRRTA
ncbi:LacI family DNA-binding transcriptional regulator [Quadrisphaera oryzae]|uniref:LacI family DNA-binding transcriptional regulator n=1 Tax=Quadrisphaera TaxID=317661 RepID=UPI00164456DC|nr:LacI family DNA-binding transcriptional regulator [Quadrisphaera sp. RL12-1S]